MGRSRPAAARPVGYRDALSRSDGDPIEGSAPPWRAGRVGGEDATVELLVVRHAIAEDSEAFARTGKGDAERPLTREGRRKFQGVARGLREVVDSVDLLATSPLVRAVETGALLEAAFGVEATARLPELSPDAAPPALVQWLRRRRRHRVVAVVGHEPHLSHLIGYLLAGQSLGLVELKKGGACLLDLGTAPEPGRARLAWLLTPGQLRRLGR